MIAKLADNVKLKVCDAKTGELLREISSHNLVVDAGLNTLRDMIGGVRNAEPNFIGLGEGNSAPDASDVALDDEKTRFDITRRLQGSKKITFQLYVPQDQGNGFTYEEAGLFNVRNGVSTLFARVKFTPVVKTASVTISLSWIIELEVG